MKRIVVILGVVLVLGAVGAASVWYFLEERFTLFATRPFGSATAKVVEIPSGTNPRGVATILARSDVVSDADLLYGYLRREKLGPRLKAGEYEFTGPMTPAQVIGKITRGEVKQHHFTVPEGLRVDEILPILAASDLRLSRDKLEALAKDPTLVRKLGVPADGLEGFLYPDTYSFPRGATEEQVLARMVSRTIEEFNKAPRKPGVELDLLQAITLASIVEKETGASQERPRIACVFHNRLRLNMRLDTDPTVIYAKMLITGSYSKNLTRKDLEADHPYNTYRVKGLPPGPIASPGAAAIQAALNPINCEDLFFVSRNDGTHVFCPDLKCHEANVQKWQRDYFNHQR